MHHIVSSLLKGIIILYNLKFKFYCILNRLILARTSKSIIIKTVPPLVYIRIIRRLSCRWQQCVGKEKQNRLGKRVTSRISSRRNWNVQLSGVEGANVFFSNMNALL